MEDQDTPIDDVPGDEPALDDVGQDEPAEVAEVDVPEDARERLAHEGAVLEHQLEELGVGDTELEASFDENHADAGQVAAEQGEHRILAQQLRDQLDDVEAALARIEDGTYGTCEVCGEPIGEDRLDAMPATRVCIAHAG